MILKIIFIELEEPAEVLKVVVKPSSSFLRANWASSDTCVRRRCALTNTNSPSLNLLTFKNNS